MEIPDPPGAAACASCAQPLRWLYSARTAAWVAFVPDPADSHSLRVHRCQEQGSVPEWRDAPPLTERSPEAAERAHRGAALAAEAISRSRPASVRREPIERPTPEPSALDRLRGLTPGPDWADPESEAA